MPKGLKIGQLVKVVDNFWAKGYRRRVGTVVDKKRWARYYRFRGLAGKRKYTIHFIGNPYNYSGKASLFGLVDLKPLTKQEKFLWQMRRDSGCLREE